MMHTPHSQHSFYPRVTIFALAIVLWASFAYVEHQVDYHSANHQHHHCELFASSENGVNFSLPALPTIPQQSVCYQSSTPQQMILTLPNQKARSPPPLSFRSIT